MPPPPTLRGRSLLPLAREESHGARPAFSEGLAFETHPQAVIAGRYKLIRKRHLPGHPVELYDLETDLGEQTNLAKKFPAKVAELQALMRSIEGGDRFEPDANRR